MLFVRRLTASTQRLGKPLLLDVKTQTSATASDRPVALPRRRQATSSLALSPNFQHIPHIFVLN